MRGSTAMRRRLFWISRIAVSVAFFVCPAILANAQSRASLHGTITDARGAPLANSIVTLSDSATNQKKVVTSDVNGTYEFNGLGLGPAPCSLTVEHEGFRKMVSDDLEVIPEQLNAMDVQLERDEVHRYFGIDREFEQIGDAGVASPVF